MGENKLLICMPYCIVYLVFFVLACLPGLALAKSEDALVYGKYLTAAAGCQACHTDVKNKGKPFAGGRALETPFGTFYTPNITPDRVTGIGHWDEADFLDAVKRGISPQGSHYFPAFPYTSYTKMTDQDALQIFAYLKSRPGISQRNRNHDVSPPFSWRWLQWGWKILFFKEQEYAAPVGSDQKVARGGYLVDAMGHCGECHTTRNFLGGTNTSMYMAGAVGGGEGELVSNITPDIETGIGDWTEGDLTSFLDSGMKPDFDDVQGSMEEVIIHGTSQLTKEDRAAIAAYLLSLPPISNKIEKKK